MKTIMKQERRLDIFINEIPKGNISLIVKKNQIDVGKNKYLPSGVYCAMRPENFIEMTYKNIQEKNPDKKVKVKYQ